MSEADEKSILERMGIMRYNSTKSVGITIVMFAMLAVLAGGLVLTLLYMTGGSKWFFAVVYLLTFGMLLWIYFATYYELRENTLYMRSGPFAENVPYVKIRKAVKCRGYKTSMALSTARIELIYGRSSISGRTFISPEREDEFLAELQKRCPKLKIEE